MPDENDEKLVLVPIPPLVAVLTELERDKGAPLTEAEVLAARDEAACVVMPQSAWQPLVQSRGHDDVRPQHVWQDWLDYKAATGTPQA